MSNPMTDKDTLAEIRARHERSLAPDWAGHTNAAWTDRATLLTLLDEANRRIELMRGEWYSPEHMDAVHERTIDPLRARVAELEARLNAPLPWDGNYGTAEVIDESLERIAGDLVDPDITLIVAAVNTLPLFIELLEVLDGDWHFSDCSLKHTRDLDCGLMPKRCNCQMREVHQIIDRILEKLDECGLPARQLQQGDKQ